jgi:hypothetical protein
MRKGMWLIATACLFTIWIGYLGSLAYNKWQTPVVILARPQFLVSDLDVIAQVDSLDAVVVIQEIRFRRPELAEPPKEIRIANLQDCAVNQKDGIWTRPGSYILPLTKKADDTYEITMPPRSPGAPRLPPLIYEAQADTKAQLRDIANAKNTAP